MSMGGVLAAHLWKNRVLEIGTLIMESSPLMYFGKLMAKVMIKQYLTITHKAQKREPKTVRQAVGSMVTEAQLDDFLNLLDHISDRSIENYLSEIGKYKFPSDIDTPETKVFYYYGSKASEVLFRRTAKAIKKHYPDAETICFAGKGHCTDALFDTAVRIAELDRVLEQE